MPRRILVYEPEATGHQMELLRYLLDAITQQVADVWITLLTTTEAAEHPNCQRLAADFSAAMDIRIAPEVTDRHQLLRFLNPFYERQWQSFQACMRGIAAIGPDAIDFVLLPHLEAIGLLQLGMHRNAFAGLPWATITVGARFHHREAGISGPTHWQDRLQGWFFKLVVAQPNLVCFGAVNPYLAQTVQHPKVVWCPEPAPKAELSAPEIARKAYGLRAETTVVLVFGFISRRKCVDVLLASVAALPPDQDVTIFLAGTQHSGHMRPILDSDAAQQLRARGRLVEENRFIMVGPDIDPMSVADICWIFYERNFVYTGNVLVRSAHAGRAVICRNQGVIGMLVNESGCGIALDSEDPDIVAAAILRLGGDPELRDRMGAAGQRAFAQNTPEAFAQPIVDSIKTALAAA